jgi:hypothetical protein
MKDRDPIAIFWATFSSLLEENDILAEADKLAIEGEDIYNSGYWPGTFSDYKIIFKGIQQYSKKHPEIIYDLVYLLARDIISFCPPNKIEQFLSDITPIVEDIPNLIQKLRLAILEKVL